MKKTINDLSGKIFSYWTVISYAGRDAKNRTVWNVLCRCGTKRTISYAKLMTGRSKSCGCRPKGADISGERFGSLIAIRPSGEINYGGALWECSCDCGGIKIATVGDLNRGNVKSCGCLYKKRQGEAMRDATLAHYKRQAKKRNLLWELSDKEALKIMSENCMYCGRPPSNKMETVKSNGAFYYSGIDRIDNHLGYVAQNVAPCCSMCNVAKNNHSVNEFKSWVLSICKHMML